MKNRTIFPILIVFSVFISSCKYDFILPEVVPPVATGVSFSKQVAPIFTIGDKCTSCHEAGATDPDLTTANAFAQINTAKYINKTAPAESRIYAYPAPGTTTHTRKKYTAGEAAIILQWITEGAKNN